MNGMTTGRRKKNNNNNISHMNVTTVSTLTEFSLIIVWI